MEIPFPGIFDNIPARAGVGGSFKIYRTNSLQDRRAPAALLHAGDSNFWVLEEVRSWYVRRDVARSKIKHHSARTYF
jgi:hypothetical protein